MGQLKRVLDFPSVLFITINSIIGSGMFFLPGIAAYYSGPSSIIAWFILALMAIYTAMCFGELVSMFPYAGGVYEFSKQAYGRFTSFIIGWMAWLVGNVTTAMLVVGAVEYLLPIDVFEVKIAKILISIFWVIAFNWLAYRGIKTSSFMLITFSLITLFIITILISTALMNFNISNYEPFFIHDTFWKNFSYVFLTIFFISETFFGLESVTFLAEETKNPEKVLPKALIISTIIIAILSIFLVLTSLGAINYKFFGMASAPFTLIAKQSYGLLGSDLITLGTYLVIMGAAAGWVVTGPRLILALTRDKLFIPKFNAIHKEFGTPHKAIMFQCIMTILFIIMAFFGSGYKTLLSMLIPLVLIMMSFSILTVPILRIKKPNLKRHYKAPFGMYGPIFLVFFHLILLITWIIVEHNSMNLLFLIFSLMFFSIPIYLLLELYYNPKTITKVNDLLAYVIYLFENLTIPKKIRIKMLNFLGDIKGRHILDLGCSVGTLTTLLTEAVGPKGMVYGIESSKCDLEITKKRLEKQNRKNYILKLDENEYNRLNPKIIKLNGVLSVGLISYIQNLPNILKELNEKLNIGDRMVFMDYDKMFEIIPNIDWLEDDILLTEYFYNAGFIIKIEREQGLAWKYIFIFAEKVQNFKNMNKHRFYLLEKRLR